MNDPRTKPLQGPFTAALAALHRATGIDLAKDANLVLGFRKTGNHGVRRIPVERRVTHVCRECGELSVLDPPDASVTSWICPWCGHSNPFGRKR
jgi:predicted RNA-binding Zn-ribbon protein involved in translation (DUF1610 family)